MNFEKTKKSGFSFSGLGISFGTEKLKETERTVQANPIGSTVATLEGETSISAGQDVLTATATISGKEGVIIAGQNVILVGEYATYEGKNTLDYSKSGLTVALGGFVVSVLTPAASMVRQADDRDSKTLATLEYGEVADEEYRRKTFANSLNYK